VAYWVEAQRLIDLGFDPQKRLVWASKNQQTDRDLESVDPSGDEIVIEVKAVSTDGRFRWTRNEWILAQMERSRYFLYLVFNAGTTPRVVSYQDPIGLILSGEMELDFEVMLGSAPLAG
jgi:hypothetical protein